MVLGSVFLGAAKPLPAQQKPQWLPGQMGLNAGVQPSPGLSYVNMDVNYDAGAFNGPKGDAIPVSGTYNVWAVENILFSGESKVSGRKSRIEVMFPFPNGSLVADILVPNQGATNLGVAGGGTGVADLWLQPFTLGWHMKRLDFTVGDAFMVPTRRYSPGATNNIGSGYFGNHPKRARPYVTKNKATSVNLFTDWKVQNPVKARTTLTKHQGRRSRINGESGRSCR